VKPFRQVVESKAQVHEQSPVALRQTVKVVAWAAGSGWHVSQSENGDRFGKSVVCSPCAHHRDTPVPPDRRQSEPRRYHRISRLAPTNEPADGRTVIELMVARGRAIGLQTHETGAQHIADQPKGKKAEERRGGHPKPLPT